MTIKKVLFYLVNWTWGLPQNLIGLFVFLFLKIFKRCPCEVQPTGVILTYWNSTAGLSLGMFNFVHETAGENTRHHEYGHTIQSFIWGILWLFVYGIPSLIWAGIYGRISTKHDYYWFYTEASADAFGGVERGPKQS